MPLVAAEDLVKTYRVAERRAGLWGAVRGIARRRYRTVVALDRVSFALEAGELVGYIGPNGAGKSTTVKLLSGIVVPDSGQYLPLPLMPDWIELLSEWLPFRGLIDIPFRLYLGHVPVEECLPLFLHQLAWIAVLVLAGRRALARGTRRLVVQGG